MIRNNLISVVFKTVPEGTNYRTDGWCWVNVDKGQKWIDDGLCKEWKPAKKKRVKKQEPVELKKTEE